MKPPSSTATPLWWRTVDQELRLFFVAKNISPGELKLSLLGAFGTKGGQDFAIDVKDLDARNYITLHYVQFVKYIFPRNRTTSN